MKFVLSLFFDRQYLQGRHFDEGLAGYIWAFRSIWTRNFLRLAPSLRFPASYRTSISNDRNIDFHPDDLNNFQSPGTYFQNFAGKIQIGQGSYIAPNVGIITANHDPSDLDRHLPAGNVTIGENCWIGMNSVLLPGITLGPRTIVGAGSVVTKSFTEGYCVVAGNPARLIKFIDVREKMD
ncbi:MAG: acyltransferase [Betaproteobacteria bacterium]